MRQAAGGVGWPTIDAMIAAVVWALKSRPRLAWVVLAPANAYFIIVIAQACFVYARFHFPVLALVCILTGVAAATLWRRYAT